MSLLEVSELRVEFPGGVEAVRGVSFTLERGDSLAIIGESGAGKSTLARCLVGLVQPPDGRGSVRLAGTEILGIDAGTLRDLRWSTVAMAMQGTPFNPVMSIGNQVGEPLRDRRGAGRDEANAKAHELAAEVGLDPELLDRFPHELSGGQRRLATLAMVLALDPDLVILDEPTAGLDASTRNEVVTHLNRLAAARGFARLVITHDLHDAARLAERTMVMYAGEIIESGTPHQVLDGPAHPYTWALAGTYPVMSSTKDLRPIRGTAPDPRAVPNGCAYHPRCTQATDICTQTHPDLAPSRGRMVACHFGGLNTLLAGAGLTKTYSARRRSVRALDGVSITVAEGESVGVIGPSGSGKSTLAAILAGHLAADSGTVSLEGALMPSSWRGADRMSRRRIQMVMQDPADALSPRLSVEELVREPLDVAGDASRTQRRDQVIEALAGVGLSTSDDFLKSRSHELSGGQQQRIVLARALVTRPKLLVADEPTSMLDASEQARLLVILRERQIEMGLGLVLVSHDLAVVRKVTDRIVVLDAGRVVEEGPSHRVSSQPQSATARRLLQAAESTDFREPPPVVQAAASNSESGHD